MIKFSTILIPLFIIPMNICAQFNFADISSPYWLPLTSYGSLDSADVDGDGDVDLILIGSNTGSNLYLNNGDHTFTSDQSFTDVYNSDCKFADVDNDGDYDLIYTGTGSGTPNYGGLFKNDGSGNFTVFPFLLEIVSFGSIEFADLNGDGDIDIIIAGEKNNGDYATIYYKNNGNGVYVQVAGTPFVNIKNGDVEIFDVDEDGDEDVILSGRGSTNLTTTNLYINDGNGVFSEVSTSIVNLNHGDMDHGDIDNDGDLDLIISGQLLISSYVPYTHFYENDGTGNFSELTSTNIIGLYDGTVKLGDFDLDSDLDLFTTGKDINDSKQTILYENDGAGNFTLETTTSFEPTSSRNSTLLIDLDSDNDLDIITIGKTDLIPAWPHLYDLFSCDNDMDLNVSNSDPTLISQHSHIGASYIWLDCDNGYQPINNTNNPSFTPSSNGSYAVRINQYGCIDTSSCYTISSVGIEETVSTAVKIYPNPSKGLVNISNLKTNSILTIHSISGNLVLSQTVNSNSIQLDMNNQRNGIYLITVESEEQIEHLRWVKQ